MTGSSFPVSRHSRSPRNGFSTTQNGSWTNKMAPKYSYKRFPRNCFMLILSLLLTIFLFGVDAGIEGCPKKCFCNPMNKYVYCSKKNLNIIPDALPESTQQLNLNGNSFRSKTLQRINVSSFGSLEHLYISECGLEQIEVGAFSDMANLRWLDLSENKLTHLHENTFQGLNLKHLFLNNNRMLQLTPRSFIGLVTSGLHLHNCSLASILPEILEPLKGTLKNLWLNGNLIETFDERLKEIFSTLSHLRLGANPIRCKCDSSWLKDFFDSEQNIFKGAESPSCRSPAKVKNQSFENLTKAQFSCQAPAFNNIGALFEPDHANLKCSAGGDPTPTLFWILPSPSTLAFKYDPPPVLPQSSSSLPSSSLSSSPTAAYAQQHQQSMHSSSASADEYDRNEAILHLKMFDHSLSHHSEPSSSSSSSSASSSTNVREAPLVNGMYICVANNRVGNVTLTINVTWPNHSSDKRHHHHLHHRHHSNNNAGSDLPKPIFNEAALPKSRDAEDPDPGQVGKDGDNRGLVYSTPMVGVSPVMKAEEVFRVREESGSVSIQKSFPREGIFSLAELVVAVVATHLLTVALVLCLLFIRNAVVKSRRQKARYIDGPLHAPPLTPTGPLISSTPRLPAHIIKDRLQNSDPTYDKVGQFSDIYSNSSVARYTHHQFINR